MGNLAVCSVNLERKDKSSSMGNIKIFKNRIYFTVQARLYEAVYEVYKIIIPIHGAKRQFKEMEKIHVKLVDCFQNIVAKVKNPPFLFDHFTI